MAFNLFDTLSARSRTGKSVLAVVTILVMFMFVLSSGAIGSGNDIFDQLGSFFSSSKGRGPVVATAYGDDVRSSELDDVRKQRQAATEFLARAVSRSYSNWAKALDEDVRSGRVTSETRRDIERIVSLRAHADESDKDARAYREFLIPLTDFRSFNMGSPDVRKLQEAVNRARLKPDSDDKRVLDGLTAILAHDASQGPGVYLVPIGNESDRDVLDFLLLLKKADRLGIRYSKDAVMDLVKVDSGNRLTNDDMSKVAQQVRQGGRMGNVSTDWLIDAIANEYRAREALLAIEGKSPELEFIRQRQAFNLPAIMFGVSPSATPAPIEMTTASGDPGGLTPYEFLEFYKDRCSENSFDVLVVNAEAFLDQVKDPPTPTELKALFAKYRGELPDPAKDRPGFKEPKKQKLEFVTLDATAPRVTQAIPKVQAASVFLCASSGMISGSPVAALAAAAQPSMAETLPVRKTVAEKMEANLSRYQPVEQYYLTPRDTSVFRPRPIVSAIGMLAGYPDLTTVIGTMAAVHQQVERIDQQTRIPFLLQPVLTPFNPTLANALGMPAFAYALNPKLPPEGLYLPEATATVKKEQRRNLFTADVHQLEEKLHKLTTGDQPITFPPPKPDKAKQEKNREEAKKYLAEWLKERGLTPAATKVADDQFKVAKDPDLKPLNDLAVPEADGSNSLSKRLFPEPNPQFAQFDMSPKPFEPFWFPIDPFGEGVDKPNHLVWVTEEQDARTYNNLENADKLTNGEMSKRVERAWKLDKARALAKAEADRLADRVREIGKTATTNAPGVERQLKDIAAEKKLREFTLERMAVLKFEHGATPGQEEYKAATIDKSYVLYPTADFTGKLLELRKEPLGAVTVLADSPRTSYYVACLIGKTERTVEQFREVFAKTNATIGKNQLYGQYALPEQLDRAVTDVRLRLRADAGLDLKDAFKNRERKEEE
jgi:hypothetical protein